MASDADFDDRIDALGTPFDGLDGLTPEAVRTMPQAEFDALFAPYRSLDDVPWRAAGDRADPDAGDHLFPRCRGAGKPIWYVAAGRRGREWVSTGECDLDRARVAFLIRHARANGRARRGTRLTVEQVESMPVARVLRRFSQSYFFAAVPEHRIHSMLTYELTMRRLARAFRGWVVGDVRDDVSDRYYRMRGCPQASLCKDMWLLKYALNGGLSMLGVRHYRVEFRNPPEAKPQKETLSLAELQALMTAALGHYVDPATGTWATEVDPATGETVLAKRHGNSVLGRKVYLRLIPFGVATGSRHTVMTRATYTDPNGPWLDVDNGIFWRDGKKKVQDRKRGGPVALPPGLLKEVGRWREEDSRGWNASDHPFHKANGKPYARNGIPTTVWNGMVEDSGIGRKFRVRNMKDVFVDIAETEGLTRAQMAAILSTHEKTLERRYGADANVAAQWEAVKKLERRTNFKKAQAGIAAHRASVEKARTMPRPKPPRPPYKPTGRPVGRPRKHPIGPPKPAGRKRGRPRKALPSA